MKINSMPKPLFVEVLWCVCTKCGGEAVCVIENEWFWCECAGGCAHINLYIQYVSRITEKLRRVKTTDSSANIIIKSRANLAPITNYNSYNQKRLTLATTNNNGANLGFENQLWAAADKLRGHLDASEYKHVVLGFDIWNWISIFNQKHRQYGV